MVLSLTVLMGGLAMADMTKTSQKTTYKKWENFQIQVSVISEINEKNLAVFPITISINGKEVQTVQGSADVFYRPVYLSLPEGTYAIHAQTKAGGKVVSIDETITIKDYQQALIGFLDFTYGQDFAQFKWEIDTKPRMYQ